MKLMTCSTICERDGGLVQWEARCITSWAHAEAGLRQAQCPQVRTWVDRLLFVSLAARYRTCDKGDGGRSEAAFHQLLSRCDLSTHTKEGIPARLQHMLQLGDVYLVIIGGQCHVGSCSSRQHCRHTPGAHFRALLKGGQFHLVSAQAVERGRVRVGAVWVIAGGKLQPSINRKCTHAARLRCSTGRLSAPPLYASLPH